MFDDIDSGRIENIRKQLIELNTNITRLEGSHLSYIEKQNTQIINLLTDIRYALSEQSGIKFRD